MAREDKLNAALKTARDFIEFLAPSRLTSEIPHFDLSFRQANEGSISLSDDEARRYRHCLRVLWESVSHGEQISARAVERLFQDAIFESLDIRKKRSADFNTRVDGALSALRAHLTAPPQSFLVYLRVNGLDREGLDGRVGKVEFVVFDGHQLNRFREAVEKHKVDEGEREIRGHVLISL